MPKISIYEQDISAVDTTNILENVVFIPGIASQGEIGVAKYFNNITDFKKEYGDNPVQFTKAQNYPNSETTTSEITTTSETTTPTEGLGEGVFAAEGDYEPSFIYACELLNAGLPIIFERLPQTVADGKEISPALTKDTFKPNQYYTRSGEKSPYTYTLAKEFDSSETYYSATYNEDIISDVYKALKNIVFAKDTTTQKYELADKDKYNIKFITSG